MSANATGDVRRLAELNVKDIKKIIDSLIRLKARIEHARKLGATGDAWFDQEERVVQAWLMLDAARTAFRKESKR